MEGVSFVEKPIYLIYWKNSQIGKIFKNTKNQYKYIPDVSVIDKLSKEGLVKALVYKAQLDWGEMPIFFKTRIETDPDFENNCISNTDHFRITKFNQNSLP